MRWLHKHSLPVALFVILAAVIVVSIFATWHAWAADQAAHHEPLTIADFAWYWCYENSVNLVAELLGALFLVFGTKHLREAGSPEAGSNKDPDAG